MGIRIGADVGGTFTDIVIELADGSYSSTKVLTTHQAPELGILDGISRIAAQEAIALEDVEQIIHGTTLATNALIERRGAKTALVTTDGFRDVIETRTESRFEQYDLNIVLPTPLIQRADRHVISERLNARGETLVPFDEDGARALIARIADEASAACGPVANTAASSRSRSGSSTPTSTRSTSAGSGSSCSPRSPTSPARSRARSPRRCGSTNGSTPSAPTPTCSP